jgi:hypothetical protein
MSGARGRHDSSDVAVIAHEDGGREANQDRVGPVTPRARKRPPGNQLGKRRAEGVAAIVRMLDAGDWGSGSAARFAEEWGLTMPTASDWAGEAARQKRALDACMSPEERRGLYVAKLERLARGAEAAGELNSAVRAVEVSAKLEGVGYDDQRAAEDRIFAFMSRLVELLAERLSPEAFGVVQDAYRQVQAEGTRRRGER